MTWHRKSALRRVVNWRQRIRLHRNRAQPAAGSVVMSERRDPPGASWFLPLFQESAYPVGERLLVVMNVVAGVGNLDGWMRGLRSSVRLTMAGCR